MHPVDLVPARKPGQRRLAVVLLIALVALTGAACAAPSPATPSGPAAATTANPAEEDATEPAAAAAPLPTPTAGPAAPSTFAPEQVDLTLTPVAAGLDRPLFATHAGDGSGRLFIVEKPGTIVALRDGTLLPTPFLDIRDRVRSSGSEQGLLGLAFAPNYAESGHLFVNYTDQAGHTVIARYQASPQRPDVVDAATETVVLRLEQPAANHNGGMLAFGPDGYLYIGTGDGGAANDRFGNGQNPATLLGKMLRIDVTTDPGQPYTVPADNPWVAADWNGADVRDEVWAVGLRNPWRYSFDRATGDLWIADVGQNAFEEVNVTPAGSPGGLNYGWPIMEGTHCFPAGAACDSAELVLPVAEYGHSGHCSVTGGYVYRGLAHPQLQGVYFFGDYCSGVIWAQWPGADGSWQSGEALRSGLTLSSFGEDEAGEMYVTDLGGGGVYRLDVP